jgi:hypothetical protein
MTGGFSRDILDDCPSSSESIAYKEPIVLLHDENEYESKLSFEITSDFNECQKIFGRQ